MYPTSQAVCRLLGGSGRPQLIAVPKQKLPALCTSFASRPTASNTVVFMPLPLPLVA